MRALTKWPSLCRGFGALAALAPALAFGASLHLDKGPVVLGQTESVGVTVRIDEQPGTESRPLRLSVNVGSFGEVKRVGPGVFRTTYMPPTTRFPQVALVAAWRETGPEAPIDFLRIPLYGLTKVDVSARKGSLISARVGPDTFGPVRTNAKGKATIQLTVPPNVPEAVIEVKDRSGRVTTRASSVDVPPYNRLTLALVPHALVADGESWARVEVLYDSGTEVPADRIRLVASIGQLTLLRTERGGRFVYKYVPPAGASARSVQFTAQVAGDRTAKGTGELALGLPPPATITVVPPEKPVPSDGHSTATVTVRVFDANGLGLPQQPVEVLANGKPLSAVSDQGSGTYHARFVAPESYPAKGLVQLQAKVKSADGQELTAQANYQVLAPPLPSSVRGEVSPSPVVADGSSRAVVSLDVRDSAGRPLTGATLILLPSHGSVTPLTELGDGRYRAEYLAPSQVPSSGDAVLKVVDSTGQFESAVAVPLRAQQHLLLGARVALVHSLGELVGPRAGLDLWVPIRAGSATLGVGLSALYAQATQRLSDPAGTLTATARAVYVPVTGRFGLNLYTGKLLTLTVGPAVTATWVRVRNSLNPGFASRVGVGAGGFFTAALNLGPGQLFGELGYSYAPVESTEFRLDAGGVGVELGYRFGLF